MDIIKKTDRQTDIHFSTLYYGYINSILYTSSFFRLHDLFIAEENIIKIFQNIEENEKVSNYLKR